MTISLGMPGGSYLHRWTGWTGLGGLLLSSGLDSGAFATVIPAKAGIQRRNFLLR